MRRSVGLAIALVVSCSAPVAPPPPTERPPRPAALECILPYQSNIGNQYFLMADLDKAVSCEVYVEHDECRVGIFRDCTDLDVEVRRQWLGEVDPGGGLAWRFNAFHPDGGIAARPPAVCQGEVHEDGLGYWSHLECTLRDDNAGPHVGVYLESLTEPATPFGEDPEPITINAATNPMTDVVYLPAREEVWGVVEGSGVFRVDLSAKTSALAVADGLASEVARAPDDTRIFIASGANLKVIDVASISEVANISIGATIHHLVSTPEGIVVATEAALELRTFADPGTAASTAVLSAPARDVAYISSENIDTFLAVVPAAAPSIVVYSQGLSEVRTIEVETEPSALISTETVQLGFLATCTSKLPQQHCYFDVNAQAGSPIRRMGIPDGGGLVGYGVSPDGTTAYLSAEKTLITQVDIPDWRPRIRRRITAGPFLRMLLSADGMRLYGVALETPQIDVIKLSALPR